MLDWGILFSKQEKLDQYIIENHQLHDQDLFEEKMLALLVELGELANETRCFKFWSEKKASERSIILEEYVDNIHFILSLGLTKQYEFSQIEDETSHFTETEQFNDVFKKALKFYTEQTKETYITLFQSYIQLGALLGFTVTDIIKAYDEKNEVNYERQDQGY